MPFVFSPPLEPMLAKLSNTLPESDGWIFEPKWDGFRAIVYRDGPAIYIQSRDLKPLNRYFPEVEAALLERLPEKCIVDGEIVIAGPRGDPTKSGLQFEALLLRIHPAASRVKELAATTPGSFVAWDLMALGDDDLRERPFEERRALLERELASTTPPLFLTPATRDRAVASDWFSRFEGAGLDGVMAKRPEGKYEAGKRAMIKIKHARTADCAVAGFRWHKEGKDVAVGSLLLGLYDDKGDLHHVGICASFTQAMRRELVGLLAPLRDHALDDHPWRSWSVAEQSGKRMPGGTSRWNRGKDLSWEPLRIERVAEVGYDHLQGRRFRHATHFKRWRDDKSVRDCTYAQLETVAPFELEKIFARA